MKAVITVIVIVMATLISITIVVQDKIVQAEVAQTKPQTWAEQIEQSKEPEREWEVVEEGDVGSFELIDDASAKTVMSISRPDMTIKIHGDVPGGEPMVIIYPTGRVDLNGRSDINEAAQRFWQAVMMTMPECYKEKVP